MTNPTAPSERLLYPNLSTVNDKYINQRLKLIINLTTILTLQKILEIIMKLKPITIIRS